MQRPRNRSNKISSTSGSTGSPKKPAPGEPCVESVEKGLEGMISGRLNIIAGGIGIVLAGPGGFALGFTMDPCFGKGFYAIPLGRVLLKTGHTHGFPIAFYNIIIGSLLDRLTLSDQLKKTCSIFTILSFIMPVGLLLRGITDGAMTFAPVVLTGSLCFFISALIMVRVPFLIRQFKSAPVDA